MDKRLSTKRNRIDYSLYLVTDRNISKGRPLPDIVEAAVRGGVSVVQLREKVMAGRDFVALALAIQAVLKAYDIPLIINDRIDVALAVHADGVHLGQTDVPLKMARRIVKGSMIIGVSTHTATEAVQAEKDGADYIGVGPVFSTTTKKDTHPVIGIAGVAEIRNAVKLPIVGIGGIKIETAAQVIQHGADGIAVVSAIVSVDDPGQAARELKTTIDKARRS